jgi:glucose/arabinose dehydrogenase
MKSVNRSSTERSCRHHPRAIASAIVGAGLLVIASCTSSKNRVTEPGYGPAPTLPAPDSTKPVFKFSTVSGWPAGAKPTAPAGFTVTRFAGELDHPRWMLCLENGDVLVAESSGKPKQPKSEEEFQKAELMKKAGQPRPSADRITLLRDTNNDGEADERHVLLENLNQPFGMAVVGDLLFVANTDAVLRFPFTMGETSRIESKGEKICSLPAGGYNNHWTRNILPSRDGHHLYISVGSASNVGEHGIEEEHRRAAILRVNIDGSGEVVFGSGLRNPVGMDFEPTTGLLWTAVNERDLIGDDLVPDYMTPVRQGEFYGWPYSYWGSIIDSRVTPQRPDLVKTAKKPAYALGPHTASLGLAFSTGSKFPELFRGGAFIGQHGSWNRSEFSGYKVVYIPFHEGEPSGSPIDFLTGFMPDPATGVAYGRPVGVAMTSTGDLLVTDDSGDCIWHVRYTE